MIILAVFIIAYGIALQAVLFPGPGKYEKSGWQLVRGILEWPYWQMYGELFLEEIQGKQRFLMYTPYPKFAQFIYSFIECNHKKEH